jgi:hypothetical protein
MLTRRLVSSLLALAAIPGCYAPTEETAASIGAALEEENGGYSMDDEAPAFGDEGEMAENEMLAPDPELVDPMESDPAVADMSAAPDAIRFRVAVIWGQLPPDRDNVAAHDWSGAFATNRGALLVRRGIALEPETDRLLGRLDPRTVAFTSVTQPHVDGLVLDIIDPEPSAEQPIGLVYNGDLPGELGSESPPVAIPLARLLDGPVELVSHENGNRMIAVAQVQPIETCSHGFTMGVWQTIEEGRGRFLGRVVGADGQLEGHVRGIFGRRQNGEQVMFGKFIGTDGSFRGLFVGRYGDGHFGGRWITEDGERGALGGHYREGGPGEGGGFLGRWGEASCGLPQ